MRAAKAVDWILVAALAYLVVTGLLLDGLVNVINEAYSVRDTRTAEGVHQPTGSLRSGGPGSLVPWDSLGWQGRMFPLVPGLDVISPYQRRWLLKDVTAGVVLTTLLVPHAWSGVIARPAGKWPG